MSSETIKRETVKTIEGDVGNVIITETNGVIKEVALITEDNTYLITKGSQYGEELVITRLKQPKIRKAWVVMFSDKWDEEEETKKTFSNDDEAKAEKDAREYAKERAGSSENKNVKLIPIKQMIEEDDKVVASDQDGDAIPF